MKSGTERMKEVLDELLKLSPEDLRKKIDEYSGEKHEITELLERAGYDFSHGRIKKEDL